MKILFTDATLMHGGAERVISILANGLIELGHEVDILLYYEREIWYELNSKIKVDSDERHIGKSNPIKHIVFRHNYFKQTDADIIISFLAPINMINILAMSGINKPLIVADRNDPRKTPVNPILRNIRNFLYNFADGIVFQSKKNKEYFSNSVQRKSTIIYNPVDVGAYRGKGLHNLEAKQNIISVGRLIKQKNPCMLLNAFSEIAEEFPNVQLIYYGEGNLRKEIEEKIVELGLSGRVETPGAVHDIFDKVANARLYVMTSDYEGMPNALIEAMCIGVPVISTKVSGAVDLISDNVNGILIDCNSELQLTQAMRKMLNNSMFSKKCAEESVELNEKLATKQILEDWLEYIEEFI